MKKMFYLAFIALASFGCQSDDPASPGVPYTPPVTNQPPVAVAFTEVQKSSFPNLGIPHPGGVFVINNLENWKAFLKQPQTNQFATIDLELNYSAYTYLAVRHDYHAQSNENVDVNIETIIKSNNIIKVSFIKTTNAPGETTFPVESQPYHIVRIAKTNLPITFEMQ